MDSNDLHEYRQHLVFSEQKSQSDYDKTILTLSGGALAISFSFLKDYVGDGPIYNLCFLFLSWISWASSVTLILVSFYVSRLALNKAIEQVDNGTILNEKPGGRWSYIIDGLNALGGILFVIGVILMISFTSANLAKGGKGEKNTRSPVERQSTISNTNTPEATR